MPKGEKSATENLRRRFHLAQMKERKGRFKNTAAYSKRPALRGFEQSGFHAFMLLTKRVLLLLTIGVTVIGGIYLISFSSFFNVDYIQFFEDDAPVDTALFSTTLEPYRGRNILFINTRAIETEISERYRTFIQFIEIEKKYPGTLRSVFLRFPAALNINAASIRDDQAVQKKFVISSEGIVIEENTSYPQLPFLSTTIDAFPAVGAAFLTPEETKTITAANELFINTFGMNIQEIIYKKAAREIHLKTEKGFLVWLDMTQAIEHQILKLKRALPKLDIYHESLAYIDLRISGKNTDRVIYRKKDR